MATSNDFFFRGQNVFLKIYQETKNIYFAGKDWDVNENATEVADGVSGEKRDRLDKVTNYYEANLNIYQSDQSVMQMLMDAQDVADAAGLPLSQTASIIIEHRDGTKAAYMLRECVFGPWKTGGSNRQDAVMLGVKIRFRWFKKI
jgi:hypothetical protein